MKTKANDIYLKFGANERAIVDKIKNNTIKRIVVRVIGVKLKLQWTGWLQYLIPVPIIIVLFLLALIAYLIGGLYVAYVMAIITATLSLIVLFDIITVKLKLRFPESKQNRNDGLDVFALMRKRHSCRSYQLKKLSKKDFDEIMESVERHLSEKKFSDHKIRFEYVSAPVRVWPVVNATEFLAAIAPKEYDRFAVMDVGRTLQKIVIDATRMGLGTCWIGPGADHKSITAHLGDRFNPEKDNIICVCAIGYESKYKPLFIRSFNKKMRSRLPLNGLFFHDYQMTRPVDPTKEPCTFFTRIFESCQWAPSSYNGQTTRGIVILDSDKFSRVDFVASTSSRYYAAVASGIWCANWEIGCDALNIKGRFRKLGAEEIALTDEQKSDGVPVYEISWELISHKEN